MNSDDAKAVAARALTRDATLEELRETARHLRALSSESTLADLVEAKIDQLLAERDQTDVEGERTSVRR